jgi:hypothetical protein
MITLSPGTGTFSGLQLADMFQDSDPEPVLFHVAVTALHGELAKTVIKFINTSCLILICPASF